MPSSSVAGTVRSNLVTQLQARTNLASVTVTKYPPAPDDIHGLEAIWLSDLQVDQVPAAMGYQMDESAGLDVELWVRRPGDGQDIAATVETRALALLAEVELQLKADDTISGAVDAAHLESYVIDNGWDDDGRTCQITGVIRFLTQLSAS